MKVMRILSAALFVALVFASRTAAAEGWSLAKLTPFGKKSPKAAEQRESETADRERAKGPSPIEKLNADTKRFFSKTKEAFSAKKTGAKPSGTRRSGWFRRPDPRRSTQPPNQPLSWLGSLFRVKEPDEPTAPTSLDDWMSLERQDP